MESVHFKNTSREPIGSQNIFFTIINTDGAQRGPLYIWIVYKRSFEMVWFLPLSLVEIKNIQLVSSKRNCYIMTVQLDIVIMMLVVSMNQYFYWQSFILLSTSSVPMASH